ncbi:unnamed protein product [Lactuca virosa]|uniref:Uncharacterized protein n=1 Tax=Lactuca virosa TaxID=75947 RepID=A0AAU9P4L9_9ASTR|nr:unnamed protein product [Lactuca virosa]
MIATIGLPPAIVNCFQWQPNNPPELKNWRLDSTPQPATTSPRLRLQSSTVSTGRPTDPVPLVNLQLRSSPSATDIPDKEPKKGEEDESSSRLFPLLLASS